MFTLGYGEFQSTTFWGMFNETLPFFLHWVSQAILVCVICSFLAERLRYRGVAIIVFLAACELAWCSTSVIGAWGPAHVAADVGFWAWPMLLVVIVVKVGGLWRSDVVAGRRHSLCTTAPG